MYVGIHTVLLTDCHLEKNQRHTSSAATFVPFHVPIVLFSTTYTSFDIGRNYESIFFHIQILVHTV